MPGAAAFPLFFLSGAFSRSGSCWSAARHSGGAPHFFPLPRPDGAPHFFPLPRPDGVLSVFPLPRPDGMLSVFPLPRPDGVLQVFPAPRPGVRSACYDSGCP